MCLGGLHQMFCMCALGCAWLLLTFSNEGWKLCVPYEAGEPPTCGNRRALQKTCNDVLCPAGPITRATKDPKRLTQYPQSHCTAPLRLAHVRTLPCTPLLGRPAHRTYAENPWYRYVGRLHIQNTYSTVRTLFFTNVFVKAAFI